MASLNLVALMNQLFTRAKRWWWWSLVCTAVGVTISTVLLVTPLGQVARVSDPAAGLILLLLIVGLALLRQWEKWHGLGEQVRQIMFLQDSLGHAPSNATLTELLAEIGEELEQRARGVTTNPYFESAEKIGAKRFAENLTESAFWTGHMAKLFRNWVRYTLVMVFVLTAMGWYLTTVGAFGGEHDSATIAKLAMGVMTGVANLGLISWYLKLGEVASGAMKVVNDLDSLKISSAKTMPPELTHLYSQYNCLVASNYPIFDRLHKLWGPRLNELWKQRSK